MGPSGSVEQIALARWQVRVTPAQPRFAEPGWSYQEAVARPCPRCAGTLHSLRKPYERNGRTQRYVALVCPRCPASFTLADLGVTRYQDVTRPAATPSASAPHAARTVAARAAVASPVATGVPVHAEAARRQSILRYWRSVELFGAQVLDRPDPARNRFRIDPGRPFPWQDGHPLRRRRLGGDQVWRHTLYGGVYRLDRVHHALERVFGSSGPDADERTPRGESALFAVTVDDDGCLLLDSLVLSTAAWATGRAHDPGPDAPGWLDGFAAVTEEHGVRARVVAGVPDRDDASPERSDPLDEAAVAALVRATVELLGVDEVLSPEGVRVHSTVVKRRYADEVQGDFLNSFVADDLERVAAAVAADDCGPALTAYLTSADDLSRLRRVDVREPEERPALAEHLRPERAPAGRWPARPSHPLATGQQFAINAALDALGRGGGTFAVNGPPGTGKTTMLRDLVAALVVERAERLSRLRTPADAFGPEQLGWRSGSFTRRLRPLRDDLTGFEMVVASSNNGAVANVTREIPQRAAIDEVWHADARYFPELAERVVGEPAWGLVAAVLGNKANRAEFVRNFWLDPPDRRPAASGPAEPVAAKPGSGSAESGAVPAAEVAPGFSEWLGANVVAVEPGAWPAAVAAFRTAVRAEQRLRAVRQTADEAVRRLPGQERALAAAERSLASAGETEATAAAAVAPAVADADTASAAAHAARERRQEHRALKPGTLETLFTFGRAIRAWHAEDAPLAAAQATADAAARSAEEKAAAATRAATEAATRTAAARSDRDRAATELALTRATVGDAARTSGPVPDEQWWADDERREPAGPWLDDEWNAARTRVFLAALDLHAAFAAGAAGPLRTNLRAAIDVLYGQVPGDAPEPAVRLAWQSLFLVVPVVSTTFASVARLLGPLGREALGWLLVDEAGQAAPQLAAGAIWRARRVVAVGDPLQLEPVVSALHTTQDALRRHHGVADVWLPGRTSVQALADRVSTFGTSLPGPDGDDVWVGAPLRVHRRCDDPMFDVVNTAIYGGLMVHGARRRPDPLTAPPSSWIDVAAAESAGHWIPAEGSVALHLLDRLAAGGLLAPREGRGPATVLAVSPFRAAAQELARLVQRRYPGVTAGTVHTAQGKEADVVLFVLGGDPARPGARQWAASRPNLLNVAVSRAKHRLYVIGNRASWAGLPYFGTLAAALPVVAGEKLGVGADSAVPTIGPWNLT